ncbi:MAG: hypothetical protein IT164_01720 [Bryobacterales bacterium]|nr:hypothetical protein [Bryobacterales bacterium]
MNPKRKKLFVAFALIAAAYYCGLWGAGHLLPKVAAQIPPTPFLMRQHVVALDGQNHPQITEDRVTAIRGDGMEVRLITRPSRPEAGVATLLIRPDGYVTAGFEGLAARMSAFLTRRKMEALQMRAVMAAAGCKLAHEKAAGEEQILGVPTRMLIAEQPGKRLINWRAPDFMCVDMKFAEETYKDGVWKTSLSVVPITFEAKTPPAELFDEARLAAMKEMKPSQLQALVYQSP